MSRRVLIIESEPWLGEHFERTLKHDGFTVFVATNAYRAIEVIDEAKPDVIVMDLLLSGASGLSLLHELQSYADTASIPVVVCNSALSGLSLEELRPYGVLKMIDIGTMKPEELPAAVRSVLS